MYTAQKSGNSLAGNHFYHYMHYSFGPLNGYILRGSFFFFVGEVCQIFFEAVSAKVLIG